MARKLKTIAFDLDTKALETIYNRYDSRDWHNAYDDIEKFLNGKSFVKVQGSVYDSTAKMNEVELVDLLDEMCDSLQWLPHCIKSIRGYDQPTIIDYTEQIQLKSKAQDFTLTKKHTQSTPQHRHIRKRRN